MGYGSKATNEKLYPGYLAYRTSPRFGKQKWIQFAELMLEKGFDCYLYEARQTVSKYITVDNGKGRTFKVRFSNHMPIKERELNDDCDYFVGRTHTGTRTTEMAIRRVLSYFAGHMPVAAVPERIEDDFDIIHEAPPCNNPAPADNDDKAPWEV